MRESIILIIGFIFGLLFSSANAFETNDQIIMGFLSKKDKAKEEIKELPKDIREIKDQLLPLDQLIPVTVQKELDKKKYKNQKDKKSKSQLQSSHKQNTGKDLRIRDSPIKRQWNGTCTAFGLIAAIENILGGNKDLSERHFWSQYKKYSSSVAVTTAENSYICEEKYWPQKYTSPIGDCFGNSKYKLYPGTKYLSDNIEKAIETLDKGNPLYIAMSTPTDMSHCKKYIDENSGKTGGGHALAVVGYKLDDRLKSGGYFILKNSWGTKCGDQGYQYLDHNFCRKPKRYCLMWAIDKIIVKLPEPKKVCKKWKRLWYTLWMKKRCIEYESI